MAAAIFARLALVEARRGGLFWLALACVAVGLALGAFLSQLALTESRMLHAAVVCWPLSLACALALVAAAALFVAMPLAQLASALAATAALYLLARSVSAMQAIAAGPLAEETLAQELARRAVDALALLLPALDRVTRTEWLLYGTPDWRSYALGLAGVLIYAALLAAAGVFDFQRRAA